jgi:D-alanine-D-alanine ligase
MKVAIVYNRDSKNVINLFGVPNRERIGLATIKRIAEGLRKGGHQVKALEGDKDLIDRLEEFMPRVLSGERPGMVFNLSYGIQGQARYTHVPGILEMVGIPYVGSGPLAHSLALDKVVAKMIFKQNGLPTPDFAVLDAPGFEAPELEYPLIVKPKNEAVSFGLRIINGEEELREAAELIFRTYQQPVLAEQFIEGREINIGLLGNNPPETLPPVELVFSCEGPPVYTYEDKTGMSGREIEFRCPAPLDGKVIEKAQDLTRRAFNALGCYDCARVDMRLDKENKLYILEVNSLPSLGEHGSYPLAAEKAGLDFAALVNRLIEVASARYFGTPSPPQIDVKKSEVGPTVFSYIVGRRDQMERRLQEWTNLSSRSSDPAGLQEVVKRLSTSLEELGLRLVKELTEERRLWTWETRAGFEGGTLLVGHLDVPLDSGASTQAFRRTPEWLYGEGIGVSRAPLVMLEFASRSLRSIRKLRKIPMGVLYYTDEGQDCRYSAEVIKAAAARAKRVLVLSPGNPENRVVTQRRGWRKYRLIVKGKPQRPGKASRRPEVLRWVCTKLEEISKLSSRKERIAIAATELQTSAFRQLLPHQVSGTLLLSYRESRLADSVERKMREILGEGGYHWELELVSDRPAMRKRKVNEPLVRSLGKVAAEWEIPLASESSLYPSVAGLVPSPVQVMCGIGPVARDTGTPHEAVQRISLLQRTLLLAQFLVQQLKE